MAGRRNPQRKAINLALQGGGGRGAFTWGVLDKLLEADALDIKAISGTSGGALNAVVMAEAIAHRGPEHAREQLERLWHGFAHTMSLMTSTDRFLRGLYRQWSHGGINPFGAGSEVGGAGSLQTNPLQPLLESLVDFDRLHRDNKTALYLSATNVLTGEPRIFSGTEITMQSVMAASCMPFVIHAVAVDGAAYWDGTYSGNPPLWPLLPRTDTQDVLLVHLYPTERPGTPKVPGRILERMLEITFNNSILQELRAIDYVNRLVEEGRLDRRLYREHYIHRVAPPPPILNHAGADRIKDSWPYFLKLRDAGRAAAGEWLDAHYDSIGAHGTYDFRQEFA